MDWQDGVHVYQGYDSHRARRHILFPKIKYLPGQDQTFNKLYT